MRSLFSYPPDKDLDFATVDAFLKEGISESTWVEYKSDFPSNLEKSVAAFERSLELNPDNASAAEKLQQIRAPRSR